MQKTTVARILFRSDNANLEKKLTFTARMGNRKRGRLPFDFVEKAIRVIIRRNWKNLAADITRWRKLLGAVLDRKKL